MNDPALLATPPAGLKPAGDSGEPVILEALELTKIYTLGKRRLEVLRGVSFQLRRGEILALRGASGAGKSTLLHLLGALDQPNSGHIRFAGRELRLLSNAALSRFRNRNIGYIFQAYHLLPELDALENVSLPARMARTPAPLATQRARDLLCRVGLEDRLDHKPFELSGGEQQRVAIARALINQPEVILADEPTGNLDSRTGQEIIELLLALRVERGTTLILATHDARVADRAPRILELVDGRLA